MDWRWEMSDGWIRNIATHESYPLLVQVAPERVVEGYKKRRA